MKNDAYLNVNTSWQIDDNSSVLHNFNVYIMFGYTGLDTKFRQPRWIVQNVISSTSMFKLVCLVLKVKTALYAVYKTLTLWLYHNLTPHT